MKPTHTPLQWKRTARYASERNLQPLLGPQGNTSQKRKMSRASPVPQKAYSKFPVLQKQMVESEGIEPTFNRSQNDEQEDVEANPSIKKSKRS